MDVKRKTIDLPAGVVEFLSVKAKEMDISCKTLLESIIKSEFNELNNMSNNSIQIRIEELKYTILNIDSIAKST